MIRLRVSDPQNDETPSRQLQGTCHSTLCFLSIYIYIYIYIYTYVHTYIYIYKLQDRVNLGLARGLTRLGLTRDGFKVAL